MKKYFFAIAMVFVFSSIFAQDDEGQNNSILNRLVPHSGFMLEFTTFSDSAQTNVLLTDRFYSFHAGSYIVGYHYDDRVSIGIDPSIQVGVRPFSFGTDIRASWLIQVPIYLMVKAGANSTPWNNQRLGISAGIGAVSTFMKAHYYNDPGLTSLISNQVSTIIPSAVAEITFVSRGNPVTGRFHLGLSDPVKTVSIENVNTGDQFEAKRTVSSFGFGLIYGF